MNLWPISARVMLEFDSSADDWWMPTWRTWSLGFGAGLGVGVLGVRLVLALEFWSDEDAGAEDLPE